MKALLEAIATQTRWDLRHFDPRCRHPWSPDPATALMLARVLTGIVLAAAAGLAVGMFRHPLIAAIIGAVVTMLWRGYLTAWRELQLPVELVSRYLDRYEEQHPPLPPPLRAALLQWLVLLRPLLYVLMFLCAGWYWFIPAMALSTAFALDSNQPEAGDRRYSWRHWLGAAAVVLLCTGCARLSGVKYHGHIAAGLLAAVASWLLCQAGRKHHLLPDTQQERAYLGELLAFFLLIAGASL